MGGCYWVDAMTDDSDLLRRYTEEKSEAAFAELVRRYLDLVYAVALRKVGGDAHLAEDVAQQVFADLAKKAAALARHPVLTGWLFTSAHYAATQVVRAEQRRRVREAKAHAMSEIEREAEAAPDWDRLRPLLDDLVHELNERDREAVLLRYFEGRSLAEVGERLEVSAEGARSRVDRAVEKLRATLARRGVRSTAAALGLALAGQVGVAAPAGLAATVAGAALAGAVGGAVAMGTGATAVGTSTGTAGAMVFMSTIKLQWGITAALVVAGTTGWVAQSRADAELREEIAGLRAQAALEVAGAGKLREENARLAATAAEVEALRKDDVELARLRDEVAAVKARHEQAARALADARAKRAAEIAAMPVYAEAQVDVKPEAKFQARPTIPKALRDLGGRGQAEISYLINAEGEVSDVHALSSTHPEWAAAAVAAVKQWQFEPARKNGEAVNMRRETPVVFTMETKTTSEKGLGRRFWF